LTAQQKAFFTKLSAYPALHPATPITAAQINARHRLIVHHLCKTLK